MNLSNEISPAPPSAEDAELDALYRAITDRRAFSYRADSDPLYRAAADRYLQNGLTAMRDTMGRAAALTGGYGSSYAQVAGQQQYGEYLRKLSALMPEYYELALRRYQAEGDALRDAYGLARQRRQDAYDRERDAAADARAAENAAYARQQDAYRQLYQLITGSGYAPSDEELAAAGMTRAQADALLAGYSAAGSPRTVYVGGGSSRRRKINHSTGIPVNRSRPVHGPVFDETLL